MPTSFSKMPVVRITRPKVNVCDLLGANVVDNSFLDYLQRNARGRVDVENTDVPRVRAWGARLALDKLSRLGGLGPGASRDCFLLSAS